MDKHPGVFQKLIKSAASDNSYWFHLFFSFSLLFTLGISGGKLIFFETEIVFSSCKKKMFKERWKLFLMELNLIG